MSININDQLCDFEKEDIFTEYLLSYLKENDNLKIEKLLKSYNDNEEFFENLFLENAK